MSAKSKPSLAKGSSGYYAMTTGGGCINPTTGLETQASSATGFGMAGQARPNQRGMIYGGSNMIMVDNNKNGLLQQHQQASGMIVISRNNQNEYATTFQHENRVNRRSRPFSGVQRINANKSLVGVKSGSYP